MFAHPPQLRTLFACVRLPAEDETTTLSLIEKMKMTMKKKMKKKKDGSARTIADKWMNNKLTRSHRVVGTHLST